MDNDLRTIKEVFAPNLSTIARLFVAVFALALLVQVYFTITAILRDIIQLHITILKIFVFWPAWILIRVLCVPLKFLKFVIVVLFWAICSVARGIMATLMLFGLLGRRKGRAELGSGGEGNVNLPVVRQQGRSVTPVQDMGMAGHRAHVWQVHLLPSDRPDRGGNNIGIIVGGMDDLARAWQTTTLGRDRLVAQGSLAQRSVTARGEYADTQDGRRSY